MSTAANFATLSRFPWCAIDTTFSTYVTGLSLTQAMAFWWNLYDLNLSTFGTINWNKDGIPGSYSAVGSIKLSPFALSGVWSDTFDINKTYGPGSLPGSAHNYVNGETSQTPRSRVCTTTNQVMRLRLASSAGVPDVQMRFGVEPDGANWKIGGQFQLVLNNTGVEINFADSVQAGWTTIITGTFSIGSGINFPWWCGYIDAPPDFVYTGSSGIGMSCARTDWTY